jgi:hypothetical protein
MLAGSPLVSIFAFSYTFVLGFGRNLPQSKKAQTS